MQQVSFVINKQSNGDGQNICHRFWNPKDDYGLYNNIMVKHPEELKYILRTPCLSNLFLRLDLPNNHFFSEHNTKFKVF
jgi:hypothetical protein